MVTVNDEICAVLESPDTSHWLRQALESAIRRDCVDAANDADRLSNLLARRCNEVCGQ